MSLKNTSHKSSLVESANLTKETFKRIAQNDECDNKCIFMKEQIKYNPHIGFDYLSAIPYFSIKSDFIVIVVGNCQATQVSSCIQSISDNLGINLLAIPLTVYKDYCRKSILNSIRHIRRAGIEVHVISQPVFDVKYTLTGLEIDQLLCSRNHYVFPSIWFTAFFPWYEKYRKGTNKPMVGGLTDVMSLNRISDIKELIDRFQREDLHIGMKARLHNDIVQMRERVSLYEQKLLSFGINANEIRIDNVIRDSQTRRAMWTTNHPTSWLLYKIAAVYITSKFGHTLTDAKLEEIAKVHTTSSLYLHYLTKDFATILDQRSVSYRLIQRHRDTPYLNRELNLEWPVIESSWMMDYTHYLYDTSADDRNNWRQF